MVDEDHKNMYGLANDWNHKNHFKLRNNTFWIIYFFYDEHNYYLNYNNHTLTYAFGYLFFF